MVFMQSLIVWTFALSLCLTPSLGRRIHAQQAPYDNAPQVDAPYYRVRYEGSQEEGKLVYPVAFTIWIPANVERLRGVVVHQHGCGEGSCLSGQTGAFDLHWQALASKHACGLLSPVYEQPDGADCQRWCDPRHGSDAAFQTALSDLGKLSGHPELSEVPWALWGHSGGGHWAGGMLLLHPERVAAAWLRSGVPLLKAEEGRDIKPHQLSKAALSVPMMCNLGTQEGVTVTDGRFSGVWPANQQFFRSVRSGGGLIGVAIDPLTSHECGNQRYLAIPWFDACLLARLPDAPDQALKALSPVSGWLANFPALAPTANESVHPVPAREFSGNIAESIWLPSQSIATAWTEYTNDTNVSDVTPPPEPATSACKRSN
ncbi:hypothetical protein Q31a_38700 [Aureliella helgolandensis]|uniref:Alpha/beta hydrolase family protein n=2 Tax=Aureliella helgolandensis TaxID=2527968 RepID=A0A518GAD0_9BACT|nr:hypothetical protein Q31a_38700 [Aureliella helgolandensis]